MGSSLRPGRDPPEAFGRSSRPRRGHVWDSAIDLESVGRSTRQPTGPRWSSSRERHRYP